MSNNKAPAPAMSTAPGPSRMAPGTEPGQMQSAATTIDVGGVDTTASSTDGLFKVQPDCSATPDTQRHGGRTPSKGGKAARARAEVEAEHEPLQETGGLIANPLFVRRTAVADGRAALPVGAEPAPAMRRRGGPGGDGGARGTGDGTAQPPNVGMGRKSVRVRRMASEAVKGKKPPPAPEEFARGTLERQLRVALKHSKANLDGLGSDTAAVQARVRTAWANLLNALSGSATTHGRFGADPGVSYVAARQALQTQVDALPGPNLAVSHTIDQLADWMVETATATTPLFPGGSELVMPSWDGTTGSVAGRWASSLPAAEAGVVRSHGGATLRARLE